MKLVTRRRRTRRRPIWADSGHVEFAKALAREEYQFDRQSAEIGMPAGPGC